MTIHNPHKLLVVDDDIVLQYLLEEFFRQYDLEISCLSNGTEIQKHLRYQQPDIIVLDIIMPGKNGLYWLAWLQKHYPQIPVVILSAQSKADERLQGLELGAIDYLTKPFHPKELLIRVRRILNITQPEASNFFKIGEQFFDPKRELLLNSGQSIKLTTLDAKLLTFLCKHEGEILTRDAISHALHNLEHDPMDRKIDMQVTRLRKKIEPDPSTPRHLHTVWRKGYRFTF